MGPHRTEVGAPVATRVVLAQTAEVIVAIPSLCAYSVGIAFDLVVATRGVEMPDQTDLKNRWLKTGVGPDPGLLRFGIELANGIRVLDVDDAVRRQTSPDRRAPDGPALYQNGGSSSGAGNIHGKGQFYWLWPLPPRGPIRFGISWPRFGIDFADATIDATLLLDASRAARSLWPVHG